MINKSDTIRCWLTNLLRSANFKTTKVPAGDILRRFLWDYPILHAVLPEEFCARSKNIYRLGLTLRSAASPVLTPLVHHMRLPGLKGDLSVLMRPAHVHIDECNEISMMNLIVSHLIDS